MLANLEQYSVEGTCRESEPRLQLLMPTSTTISKSCWKSIKFFQESAILRYQWRGRPSIHVTGGPNGHNEAVLPPSRVGAIMEASMVEGILLVCVRFNPDSSLVSSDTTWLAIWEL
jgi:hypothetical protein